MSPKVTRLNKTEKKLAKEIARVKTFTEQCPCAKVLEESIATVDRLKRERISLRKNLFGKFA